MSSQVGYVFKYQSTIITRRHLLFNISMIFLKVSLIRLFCFSSINRYPYGLFVASVYLIMNFFGWLGYICLVSMAGPIWSLGFLNKTIYCVLILMVLFSFPFEKPFCNMQATLIFLWLLHSTKSSHTSLLFVVSFIRSSITIKLGYLVSMNESSFRISGKPCRNSMFSIVICISLNRGCHLL